MASDEAKENGPISRVTHDLVAVDSHHFAERGVRVHARGVDLQAPP